MTLSEISAISLAVGEDQLRSAVIDTTNGFAYFATWTFPGIVKKIQLSDFTLVDSLTFTAGDQPMPALIYNGFAYFGCFDRIVKIRLSDFTEVGSIDLAPFGETLLMSCVLDDTNGFAYFGTDQNPGKIVKIRLSDFTRIGSITLLANERRLRSAAIDVDNDYMYFNCFTNTIANTIIRVKISTFLRDSSLSPGSNWVDSACIDTTNGFMYVSAQQFPDDIIKIKLSDFSVDNSLTLNVNEEAIANSAIIATDKGYAYFGTGGDGGAIPARVARIKLSDFTRDDGITLAVGENFAYSAVIDVNNGFAYFGMDTAPGIIVKVSDPDMIPSGGISNILGISKFRSRGASVQNGIVCGFNKRR